MNLQPRLGVPMLRMGLGFRGLGFRGLGFRVYWSIVGGAPDLWKLHDQDAMAMMMGNISQSSNHMEVCGTAELSKPRSPFWGPKFVIELRYTRQGCFFGIRGLEGEFQNDPDTIPEVDPSDSYAIPI